MQKNGKVWLLCRIGHQAGGVQILSGMKTQSSWRGGGVEYFKSPQGKKKMVSTFWIKHWMNLHGSAERELIQEALSWTTGHQERERRGQHRSPLGILSFIIILCFSLFLSAEFGTYLLETLVLSFKY